MDGWNTYSFLLEQKVYFQVLLLSVSRRVCWPQNQTFLEQLAMIGEVYGHCNALSYERRLIRQLPVLLRRCQLSHFPVVFHTFLWFSRKNWSQNLSKLSDPDTIDRTTRTPLWLRQAMLFPGRFWRFSAGGDSLRESHGVAMENPQWLALKIHLNGNLAGQIQRPSAARSIFSLWQCFLWQMSQFLTLHRLGWKRDKTGSVESE